MTDSYTQNKETLKKLKKIERDKVQVTSDEKVEELKDMGNALKNNICNPFIKQLSLKNRLEFLMELIP